MRTINVGLLAHVDAGKTTTAEHLMYYNGTIKELGNVNKGSSALDYNTIEKERGITVFSEQAELVWNNQRINIIDTPGHVDFAPEMERMLSILDGAVLIISAVEGIQAHTETIWHMLKQKYIPTLLFINKMDRLNIQMEKLIEDLKRLDDNLICIQHYKGTGEDFKGVESLINYPNIHEELKEVIIERDEVLLERYLNGGNISDELLAKSLLTSIEKRKFLPILFGSANKGKGIKELMEAMSTLLSPFEPFKSSDLFSGLVYKIKVDQQLGKLNFIKVLNGSLNIRDTLIIEGEANKVTSIRKYNGSMAYSVNSLGMGEIGAITGIKGAKIGQLIGQKNNIITNTNIEPVLGTRIICDEEKISDVVSFFEILNEEDPSLQFQFDKERKIMQIAIMGIIHMEVLKEHIYNRFNIDVDFEKPFVHYKETINKKSTGFCHFEPKKHFAEVEVKLNLLV